jgi:predicted dehydrogenase
MSPVPCALIGTDGYAFQLLERIRLVPHALRLVVACSRDFQGRGAALCRELGIPLVAEIPDLFALAPAGEAVIFNPTPIPLHYATTKVCLEAGFSVALEKPPVPTVQELDALSGIAAQCRREVSVGFNHLYSPVFHRLREAVACGKIGRVRRIRALAAWIRPFDYYAASQSRGRAGIDGRPLFDGVLGNPLSHALSLLLALASDGRSRLAKPVSVQAELYRSRDYITSDDTASVRILTDSGVELVLNLTVAAFDEIDPLVEIDGDAGSAVMTQFEHAEIRPLARPAVTLHGERESRLFMLEEIAAALRENRRPFLTLADCRPFTVAVNAAYESAGGVRLLPGEFRESRTIGGRIFDGIAGIEAELRAAHGAGRLLSEGDCPWARPARAFSCADYAAYPKGDAA